MNGFGRRIVLIVEDTETCAITLQIALETIPDIELRIASNAREAWRMLESAPLPVAAVITDQNLPGWSGMDLLTKLQEDQRFSGIPVVITSGDSDPRLPRKALSSGAAAVFTKPYSPAEVRKKLEQLIG
ncbi:MAG: response regulator [Acidobacteriaceae bacterium]|nr:response regulator [Acidobacteriaceae bacterium]